MDIEEDSRIEEIVYNLDVSGEKEGDLIATAEELYENLQEDGFVAGKSYDEAAAAATYASVQNQAVLARPKDVAKAAGIHEDRNKKSPGHYLNQIVKEYNIKPASIYKFAEAGDAELHFPRGILEETEEIIDKAKMKAGRANLGKEEFPKELRGKFIEPTLRPERPAAISLYTASRKLGDGKSASQIGKVMNFNDDDIRKYTKELQEALGEPRGSDLEANSSPSVCLTAYAPEDFSDEEYIEAQRILDDAKEQGSLDKVRKSAASAVYLSSQRAGEGRPLPEISERFNVNESSVASRSLKFSDELGYEIESFDEILKACRD